MGKGILEVPPDSSWTDDTQLILVIARSLLLEAEFEIPKLMDHIADGLVLWLNKPTLKQDYFQRCSPEA